MSLYLFDVDNTLIYSYPGRPANTVAEVRFLPGVLSLVRSLVQRGDDVALVSNQGGIAWGKTTRDEVNAKMVHICHEVGLEGMWLHDFIFCPHSRNAPATKDFLCACRKPNPGMLEWMMVCHGYYSPERIADVTFIGDADTDAEAARWVLGGRGVRFLWARDWHGWRGSTVLDESGSN